MCSPLQAFPEPRTNQSATRRKRLHDIQTRQAGIEARKAALLEELDELELEVQSLRQEGDDLQSWLNLPNTFIDRLPEELLMTIFQQCVYLDFPPETLMLVCRHWFHTAVGMKSIWVDLKIPQSARTPPRASRFIHRRLVLSEPTPIEVNTDRLGFIWEPVEDGRWFPTSVIIGEDGRQCRRIKQLTIGHRGSLAFLGWPLPQLEQLTYGPATILAIHDSAAIPEMKRRQHDLNSSTTPNLRTLHVRHLTLSNPPSILSNIRTLKLSICPLIYDPNDFQSYIAAATHLRTLEIAFTVYPPYAQQADPTFLIHPKIRSLGYHDESIAAGRCLLGRLDIPSADNLDIRMHDLRRIASLAQGSLGQLSWLRMEVFSRSSIISQQGDVLIDLLGQARKLEELTLVAACGVLAPKLMDALEADDSLCRELRTFTAASVNVLDGINSEALERRIMDRYNKLHQP
jgi:hypothetical protein